MPIYQFRHPEHPIVIEDVQKMTDPMSPIKEETKYTLFEDAKEKES